MKAAVIESKSLSPINILVTHSIYLSFCHANIMHRGFCVFFYISILVGNLAIVIRSVSLSVTHLFSIILFSHSNFFLLAKKYIKNNCNSIIFESA